MFNILSSLASLYTDSPITIKSDKRYSHSPSSAMCYSNLDGTPIGACMRSHYMNALKFPVSNQQGMYMTMTQQAGHLWEDWAVQRFKEMGIYIDHHTKIYDKENNVSGELDLVHFNPETNEIEVTDIKQYNGSNWYAVKEITGTKDAHPKPKDSHLLQMFMYLLTLRNLGNTDIKRCNILYIDRSCSSWYNNIQFGITLTEIGEHVYPKIEYFSQGEIKDYVDFRITEKGVYEKNTMLDTAIDLEVIPPREYTLTYSAKEVEYRYKAGQISETAYKKFYSTPSTPLGDWQCRYCKYGPDKDGYSTCYSLNE